MKGRPRRPNGPHQGRTAKQLVAVVAPEEHDAWDLASAREGITLSAWARRELTAAVGKRLPPLRESAGRSALRKSVGMRLSQDEWNAYAREVRRHGVSRNEWVRRILNRAANGSASRS